MQLQVLCTWGANPLVGYVWRGRHGLLSEVDLGTTKLCLTSADLERVAHALQTLV